MIKRIGPNELDKKYFSLRPYTAIPIKANFNKVIVNKPWGSEYLIFKNPEAEIWHLSISHQRSTSMHCHPGKKTALVVLEGRALFSTLNESMELHPLDAVIIGQGTFHSTQSLSSAGTKILEFETPPMKHDLFRLEDKYGRAQKGYEDKKEMTIDGSKLRLAKKDFGKINNLGNRKACMKLLNNSKDIKSINPDHFELAILTSGTMTSGNGQGSRKYLLPYAISVEELKEVDCTFNNVCVFLLGR